MEQWKRLKAPPAPSADGGVLWKLHPILVKGVLRIGGRLSNSILSDEEKHPIILPKDSNFTRLIIDFYHDQNAHLECSNNYGQYSSAFLDHLWVEDSQKTNS